jgi:hypothetical protein
MSEIKTTRPASITSVIDTAFSEAAASVLLGLQGAVIDLKKKIDAQQAEIADIKARIRKIC